MTTICTFIITVHSMFGMKVSFLKKILKEESENFKQTGAWKQVLNFIIQHCIVKQHSNQLHIYLQHFLLCTYSIKNLHYINKYSTENFSVIATKTIGHFILNNWHTVYPRKKKMYHEDLVDIKVFNTFNINRTWIWLRSLYTPNCIEESLDITGKYLKVSLCGTIPTESLFTNVSFIKFKLRTLAQSPFIFHAIYQLVDKERISTLNRKYDTDIKHDKYISCKNNFTFCQNFLWISILISKERSPLLKIDAQHVWIWHVKTFKYLDLFIKRESIPSFLMNLIFIINGPGLFDHFHTLDKTLHNMKLSFQCLLVHTSEVYLHNIYNITFHSKLSKTNFLDLTTSKMNLFGNLYKSKIFSEKRVYFLQAKYKTYIQLDILDLYYEEGRIANCKYGGMSVYDIKHKSDTSTWYTEHNPEVFL